MDSRWVRKPWQLRLIDLFVIVEILFIKFDARIVLFVDDGIVIVNRSTSGDEDENYTCKDNKVDNVMKFE